MLRWLTPASVKDSGPKGQSSPDDEILPVHFICQAAIIRSSIISYTFRYDAVLDPDRLHASLVELLSRRDWRRFGGRLRLNRNGRLEIHVPHDFTDERPAVRFSHQHHSIPIGEHPLGSRVPKATGSFPSIQTGCKELRYFSTPAAVDNDIRHYLNTDEPVLRVFVTTFDDATLISVTHPHSVADAMGTRNLLQAWSNTLSKRYDMVTHVEGAQRDVVEKVGDPTDEEATAPYKMEHLLLKGFTFLMFTLRYLWDLLIHPNMQTRTVYIPSGFMLRLRQLALGHVDGKGEVEPTRFLSDGDILTAWFAQKSFASRASNRSGVILNIVNIRTRVKDTFKPMASYLQNLILPSYIYLPPKVASSMPFGRVAVEVRDAINKQATDTQIRRLMRIIRSRSFPPNYPIFGKSDSMIFACTNWSKVDFPGAANFSAALVKLESPSSDKRTADEKGTCVSYWGSTIGNADHPRDTIIIYNADEKGGQWVQGFFRQGTWNLIQTEFDSYVRDADIA